jgi:aminoglycoside 6'-N-acetyltransferase I
MRMRLALWPDEEVRIGDLDPSFAEGAGWVFVAELSGKLIGFVEVQVRRYANGCQSQPVPFLEGIWVDPDFRRRGVGALLIRQVEAAVVAHGYGELGSDALLENTSSHAAHRAWGFDETERVVYFRKLLCPGRRKIP